MSGREDDATTTQQNPQTRKLTSPPQKRTHANEIFARRKSRKRVTKTKEVFATTEFHNAISQTPLSLTTGGQPIKARTFAGHTTLRATQHREELGIGQGGFYSHGIEASTSRQLVASTGIHQHPHTPLYARDRGPQCPTTCVGPFIAI